MGRKVVFAAKALACGDPPGKLGRRSFAMRIQVALPVLVVLVLALLAVRWVPAAVAERPSADAGDLATMPAAQTAAAAAAPSPVRTEPDPASAASAPFLSFDEEGRVIAAPVRDGLVLWLSSPRGAPGADLEVTAHWRKGFGLYGKDVGRTDARGRFATTVAEIEQFEGIEVQEPKLGALEYWDPLLPTAEDPRTVQLVVPELAPLRVRLVDERGDPVADAKVTSTGGGRGAVPRQHLLRGPEREIVADAQGRAELLVPIGSYELSAAADGCVLPQPIWAEVGAGGGDVALVLLRDLHRVPVTVQVEAPPGHAAPIQIAAFSHAVADRGTLPGVGGEGIHRQLTVQRQGVRSFVVLAHPLAWQCVASSQGCANASVEVGPGQTQIRIVLVRAEPKPATAQLVVNVLLPNGEPSFADVRVHHTPDLVHGSDRTAHGGRLVLELEPGARVCVSANRYGFARCVVGPFDLAAGERDVTLRLLEAQTITGRVVDRAGRGLAAQVVLHRPAGALRGLADGVPEILEDAPTGDGLGVTDGEFGFRDCGPGEHEVWVFPREGLPARKRVLPGVPVTVVAGEGLEGMQMVTGIVRDAVTHAPVEDVELKVGGGFVHWHPRSDADGRFRFVGRPGELKVRAVRRGYAVHDLPPRTIADGPVELEILLPPSPVRFLRVLDARGRALPGAKVVVLDGTGEAIDLLDQHGSHDGASQTTNGAGRVDLRGAPGGALRVEVTVGERLQVFDVPAHGGIDTAFDLPLVD